MTRGGGRGRPTARVTLLPGDGIGPEVIAAACRVLDAAGARVQWEVLEVGAPAIRSCGEPLPEAVLESIRRNGVALKGPVTTAGGGFRSVNVALRRELGLCTQVRLCRSLEGVPGPYEAVDLAVVRETTEDLYAGVELDHGSAGALALVEMLDPRRGTIPEGAGVSIKYTSERAVRASARLALEWARRNGRKKVTVVHKATVMRATDGLFLAVAREVAATFPELELDDALVDNVAAHLVREPGRYDVLFTSNLYGDILSDLAAGLVGGVGLVPGANFGGSTAVFEAAHGSAPRHAGQDRANPVAAILTGALMLRHLGDEAVATRVEQAVATTLSDGRSVTYDVARRPDVAVGTAAAAAAIIDALH